MNKIMKETDEKVQKEMKNDSGSCSLICIIDSTETNKTIITLYDYVSKSVEINPRLDDLVNDLIKDANNNNIDYVTQFKNHTDELYDTSIPILVKTIKKRYRVD